MQTQTKGQEGLDYNIINKALTAFLREVFPLYVALKGSTQPNY